jgi:hypothetical protein
MALILDHDKQIIAFNQRISDRVAQQTSDMNMAESLETQEALKE